LRALADCGPVMISRALTHEKLPVMAPLRACSRRLAALSYFLLTFCRERDSMASSRKLTIRLSTKGQVILPKSIRQRRHWDPGTRFIV
jgi:hypothetical protein